MVGTLNPLSQFFRENIAYPISDHNIGTNVRLDLLLRTAHNFNSEYDVYYSFFITHTDRWYNTHCDDKNGFLCRRASGSTDPQTHAPTPVFTGYCPAGYFGIGETGMSNIPLDFFFWCLMPSLILSILTLNNTPAICFYLTLFPFKR